MASGNQTKPSSCPKCGSAKIIKRGFDRDGAKTGNRDSVTCYDFIERLDGATDGHSDHDRICTSIVERTNLSVRTHAKRMIRLTCAFSKKRENHAAAVSLFVAHFNFCRIHRSIRMTPALKAGVTDRLWTMADLVAAQETR